MLHRSDLDQNEWNDCHSKVCINYFLGSYKELLSEISNNNYDENLITQLRTKLNIFNHKT